MSKTADEKKVEGKKAGGEHRFGGSCNPEKRRLIRSCNGSKGEEHRFGDPGSPRKGAAALQKKYKCGEHRFGGSCSRMAAFCGMKQGVVRADKCSINGLAVARDIIGKDPMRSFVGVS